MMIIKDIPGLKDLLDNCAANAQSLIGIPAKISFKVSFPTVTDNMIKDAICDVLKVEWDEVLTKNKQRVFAEAKQMYCYFSFNWQGKKQRDIYKELNYEDHTAVCTNIRKVTDQIEVGDKLATDTLTAIEKRLIQAIKSEVEINS